MKRLFDEIKMNNLTVKNRLVRSATWEGIAALDGSIDRRSYEIYEELAKGGVGLIIGGFTSVADNDYYFDGMMRLSCDSLIAQYKKLMDLVHQENCKIIAQLALGAFYRGGAQIEPDYMTADEIKTVIQQFVEAAKRAEKAGFDGVQIHAAHFFFSQPIYQSEGEPQDGQLRRQYRQTYADFARNIIRNPSCLSVASHHD